MIRFTCGASGRRSGARFNYNIRLKVHTVYMHAVVAHEVVRTCVMTDYQYKHSHNPLHVAYACLKNHTVLCRVVAPCFITGCHNSAQQNQDKISKYI